MICRKNSKKSTRLKVMLIKVLFIVMTLMFSSCSTTVINVEKYYFIIGDDVIISGSELKDNTYSQESKPDIKIPLPSGF